MRRPAVMYEIYRVGRGMDPAHKEN